MSRRNGRAKQRHSNALRPSTADAIALAEAVESRFLSLTEAWKRVNGTELPIPPQIDKDLYRWRQMRVRHRQGDFRNSEAEYRSLKAVADWTVELNQILRNQPIKRVEWKD